MTALEKRCISLIGVVIVLSQIIICVRSSLPPTILRPQTESHVATASIKKPIHNVKEERHALHITGQSR